MENKPGTLATFAAGTLELQHGGTLMDARVVYQTFGKPAADGRNVIVMPTYYTGRHEDNARMIGSVRQRPIDLPQLLHGG